MKDRKSAISIVTNLGLLIAGMISAGTGLLLQIGYHMHHDVAGSRLVLGLGYGDWSPLHKLSVVAATLFAAVHIGRHRSWYSSLMRNRRFARRKVTAILSILFVVTAVTGYLPCVGYPHRGGMGNAPSGPHRGARQARPNPDRLSRSPHIEEDFMVRTGAQGMTRRRYSGSDRSDPGSGRGERR